jgi:hypothetical protein
MKWSALSEKEVITGPTTLINGKALVRDQIANFQLRQLTATYKYLATLFTSRKDYSQKMKTLKDQEVQACNLSAYNVQNYYIYYKQMTAKV